jgi:murein DD-endopeptidase MepM/ murein hydrolase activator NlpD
MRNLYYKIKNAITLLYSLACYVFFLLTLSAFAYNQPKKNIPSVSYSESYIAQKGDNIIRYIDRQTMNKNDLDILKKFVLKKQYNHTLKEGKKITFYYKAGTQENPVFNMMTIELSSKKILEIFRENNNFLSRYRPPFKKSLAKITINITNTDFNKMLAQEGIPDDDFMLFNTFNEKINLKRSLSKGAKLSLILEKYTNNDRSIVEYKEIFYASLENKGRVTDIYKYYCPYDKLDKFYYSNGQSALYSELIKPIPDAKINSKFGYRKHPVSGKTKMHNGVDFGAPKGTPIYSASSGVVKFAGKLGGYGNHIKIDHSKNIRTEYGHLLKFAPKIINGAKISKGQLIGYVGLSGRTTGAHLHFSVLIREKYVDPLSFQISNKSILTKNHYKAFLDYKKMINSLSKKLDNNFEIAINNNNINYIISNI